MSRASAVIHAASYGSARAHNDNLWQVRSLRRKRRRRKCRLCAFADFLNFHVWREADADFVAAFHLDNDVGVVAGF